MMIDQLTHVADEKVGTVKGKSKVYPQSVVHRLINISF